MEELNEVFSQFSEIFSGSTPVMPEMAEMECLAAEFVKDGASFVERQKKLDTKNLRYGKFENI